MNEYIKIDKILKKSNRVEILFETSENLNKFFETNLFWADYDFNIEGISDSILVVPFLSNILPITWLTNAEIIVEEIDKDFFESIDKFKVGYIDMYPKVEFNDTKIKFDKIIKNGKSSSQRKGAFFSGGVDAYATLFSHIDENPLLITVWGSDIETSNFEAWKNMNNMIVKASKQYNLEKQIVKSNFKEFLISSELNKLVVNSNDKWWHGFQHGIGLIGLAAPIAFVNNLSLIYIASSYTKDDNVTCASHPSIDEYVRFCDTKIHHDQYDLNRQMKLDKIILVSNEMKKYPNLHVCWQNTTGVNCCKCEKCCRTMVGIMVANDSPGKYGFKRFDGKHLKRRMLWYNEVDNISYSFWNCTIKKYIQTKDKNKFQNEIDWIEKVDFKKQHLFIKKIFRKVEKIIEK